MDNDKLAAVERYLRVHFPQRLIEHREDFDRSCQTFKVHLEDRQTLLLKVADTVLEDTAADDLPHMLDHMEAGEALEKETGDSGILVTSKGLERFKRG